MYFVSYVNRARIRPDSVMVSHTNVFKKQQIKMRMSLTDPENNRGVFRRPIADPMGSIPKL